MFKTVKRIIDWCGEFKGKLYLGFVMTFFSHIFAALPMALAAYTVGLLIESQSDGAAFDAAWIWKTIVIQIVLVLLRFLFDYLRARLQEPSATSSQRATALPSAMRSSACLSVTSRQ